MNSKQWQALVDRARALMPRHMGDVGAIRWHKAHALYYSFANKALAESAREAMLAQGAKPSVAAAAANSPFGGKFGSWSWEAQQTHDQGPVWTIWSNRRKHGSSEADQRFQDCRKRARARQEEYNLQLSEAAAAVRAGAILPYAYGQKGGMLEGPRGWVSADGLARRLGVAPIGMTAFSWDERELATWDYAASAAFTARVTGAEIPDAPAQWNDPRARAAARAKRNTTRKPRVDRKRTQEDCHLPTWRWMVAA